MHKQQMHETDVSVISATNLPRVNMPLQISLKVKVNSMETEPMRCEDLYRLQ